MTILPIPAFLLAGSFGSQISDALFDNTFQGIHHLEFFDWAIMVPYFAVLAILSVYGLHRYETIRGYMKHRKRLREAEPPVRFTELPRVTIQLPIFNERFVVERLLEETSKIDYPRHLLQIQVLDDSTDDTHPFTEELAREYRDAGLPIEYIHRTNRHGYKAGALENGLKTATGEVVAVFDADFVPPRDFLQRTVHYFTDPKVGMVQTRWTYLNRNYNVLTEVQAILLDGHFALEHIARAGGGLFFNFNGTAGILRRSMIADAGGWQHDTLTEDSDLSYRAQLKGWKFVYAPTVECPSELPVETYGFQVQQSRWAKGLTQVAMKLLPTILRSKLPWRVKAEAFFHLTPNIGYPLMIVVSLLILPVMIVRFYMGWFEMVVIDLPLIAAAFWSISAFYLVAQRELFPKSWKRSILFLPALAGGRRGADHHQYQGGHRGAGRISDRVCAHRQIWRAEDVAGESAVSPPQRMASLCGTGRGSRVPGDRGLRDPVLQLPGDSVPAAVRGRLLLGRGQHAVERISGQAGLRAPARTDGATERSVALSIR